MINIYCLHGFLGEPADWSFLKNGIKGVNLHFINLYKDFDPSEGIEAFASQFSSMISPKEDNYLIGYSMGGRLALQTLTDHPGLFKKAVFVSTHPGLSHEGERGGRILKDGALAMRFLTEEWPVLMEKWNAQSVFAYSTQINRDEKKFNREKLADALTHWGLGQQEELTGPLSKISIPILWISGKNDPKFCEIAKSIELKHSESKNIQIDQAGHRVPWDNQDAFIQQLNDFFSFSH